MDPKVDAYIARSKKWPAEVAALRSILLGTGLDEQIKWGKPCYSSAGANIAIIQEMKDFAALMFFKGVLLPDPEGLLKLQGEHSRSAMRLEFTSTDQIAGQATSIASFVAEAVAAEEAGLQVPPAPELELVPELAERLAQDPDLATAFDALTPGRQREYNLHIGEAKKSETRQSRIDKHTDRILAGKGLRDR